MTGPIHHNFNPASARSNAPTGSSRPSGEPSGSKNFEKVMGRDGRNSDGSNPQDDKIGARDEEDIEEQDLSGETKEGSKGKPKSIFDLSSGSKPKTATAFDSSLNEEIPADLLTGAKEDKSLSNKEKNPTELAETLSSNAQTKDPNAKTPAQDELSRSQINTTKNSQASDPKNSLQEREAQAGALARQEDNNTSTKRRGDAVGIEEHFAQKTKTKAIPEVSLKQEDASSSMHAQLQSQHQEPLVNPLGDSKTAEAPRDTRMIKELIDQIAKELYVVKTGEVTDTVITIRHPPIFEGAQVKLTSFETARGQFNIAFENLSQQAKDLLDSKVNRDSLLLALNKEGYNVHIITTSTTTETPAYIVQAQKRDQEQQGQGQGRQQQEQEQRKEQQKKKG